MLQVRKSQERGYADHGWLRSFHSFSFAGYYDPAHMGYGNLRVINEDRVAPGQGFGTHGHRDMEIVSYVIDGALEHKDSMGTGSIIRPGDVQRMTAGTGVRHSEYNASKSDLVHFLQIWILPAKPGLAPGYEQKNFSTEDKQNRLRLVASSDGREGSITVHQDVSLYAGVLDPDVRVELAIAPGRHAWIQVVRGAVEVDGRALVEGDGAAVSDETGLAMRATAASEVLVFDLA